MKKKGPSHDFAVRKLLLGHNRSHAKNIIGPLGESIVSHPLALRIHVHPFIGTQCYGSYPCQRIKGRMLLGNG